MTRNLAIPIPTDANLPLQVLEQQREETAPRARGKLRDELGEDGKSLGRQDPAADEELLLPRTEEREGAGDGAPEEHRRRLPQQVMLITECNNKYQIGLL